MSDGLSRFRKILGDDEVARVMNLSAADARHELLGGLNDAARVFVKNILLIRRLDLLGESVREIGLSGADVYRRYASGQAVIDLVVKYWFHPTLIKKLSTAPMTDQLKIVDGGLVEVFDDSTGTPDVIRKDVRDMDADELNEIVGSAGFLPPSVQRQARRARLEKIREESGRQEIKIELATDTLAKVAKKAKSMRFSISKVIELLIDGAL